VKSKKVNTERFDKRFFFLVVVSGLFVKPLLNFKFIHKEILISANLGMFDSFFPFLFRDPTIYLICHLLPLVIAAYLFFVRARSFYTIFSVSYFVCSFILLSHQNSYNNAEHVVDFWLSLWMIWYCLNWNDQSENFSKRSSYLCLSIISMMFFCAGLGKICSSYLDGLLFSDMLTGKSIYTKKLNIFKLVGYLYPSISNYVLSVSYAYFVIISELIVASVIFWKNKNIAYYWLFSVFIFMPIVCEVALFSLTMKLLSLSMGNFLLLKCKSEELKN
jgi:hypothetical protein